MAAEQYFILFRNSEWKISFKEKHYGSCATQQEATEAAIDGAYATGEIGIDAEVLVQGTDPEPNGPTIRTFIHQDDKEDGHPE